MANITKYLGIVDLKAKHCTRRCSQSKGGFHSFSFTAARQWFSVQLNHVQIVTEFARSLSRAAITAWGLTYECILMIHLHSNVSSENSKCSSPRMVFFILVLMASNDEFLGAQRVTNL